MRVQKKTILAVLPLLFACGSSDSPAVDAAVSDAAAVAEDAGLIAPDAGFMDAAAPDADAPDADPPDTGPQPDNWNNFAQGFMQTYCVECHGAGNQRRDYTTYADSFRDRVRSRCGVAPPPGAPGCGPGTPRASQFPVGNGARPSAQERQRFVDWVDDGAPEN